MYADVVNVAQARIRLVIGGNSREGLQVERLQKRTPVFIAAHVLADILRHTLLLLLRCQGIPSAALTAAGLALGDVVDEGSSFGHGGLHIVPLRRLVQDCQQALPHLLPLGVVLDAVLQDLPGSTARGRQHLTFWIRFHSAMEPLHTPMEHYGNRSLVRFFFRIPKDSDGVLRIPVRKDS